MSSSILFDDDDNDFSAPTSGLAALQFGSTRPASSSITGTSSVAHPAPQQTTQPPAPSPALALLSQAKPVIALAVDSFRFVSEQYQSQGKAGISLLAAANKKYILILYKQGPKNEKIPLTVTMVSEKFKLIVRSDNYASFYDDSGCNWAARFDSVENLAKFCFEIAVAKALSKPGQSMVIQDVVPCPEGNEAVGDNWRVECNYKTFNANTDGSSVKISDVPKQKLKASSSKSGISQVVIGMAATGGKRIAVLPQSDGNFVVYDITVLRGRPASSKDNATSAPTTVEPDSSQNDGSSSANVGRTGILSRMARLGQQVMPGNDTQPQQHIDQPDQNTDLSDSESVVTSSAPPLKPHNVNRIHQTQHVTTMAMGQTGVPIPQLVSSQNSSFTNKQQLAVYQSPVGLTTPPQGSPPPSSVQGDTPQRPEWSVLFMETRQNSTEMRVALSKIQDKIESINVKLDQQHQAELKNSVEVAGGTLDGKAVMGALQKMVQEEERLRTEVKIRQDKIKTLNETISELLSDKQALIEKSNRVLSDRSDALSTASAQSAGRVLQLEEEKANMALKVSELTSEVGDLHLSVAEKRRAAMELSNQVDSLKEQLAVNQKNFDEAKKSVESMVTQVAAIKESQELAAKEATSERKRADGLQNQLLDMQKRLETTQQALSSKDTNFANALSKASEEQSQAAAKLRIAEEENSRLQKDMQSFRTNVEQLTAQLQAKMDDYQNQSTDHNRLNSDLRSKSLEIADLKLKVQTLENSLDESRKSLSESLAFKEELGNKLAALENQLLLERNKKTLSVAGTLETVTDEETEIIIAQKVKTIMNQVYQASRSSIANDGQFKGSEVLKILLGVIKQTTLNAVGGNKKTEPAKFVSLPEKQPAVSTVEPQLIENQDSKVDNEFADTESMKLADKGSDQTMESVATIQTCETDSALKENANSNIDSCVSSVPPTLNESNSQTEFEGTDEKEFNGPDDAIADTSNSKTEEENDESHNSGKEDIASDTTISENEEASENDAYIGIAPVHISAEGAKEEEEIIPVHINPPVPADAKGQSTHLDATVSESDSEEISKDSGDPIADGNAENLQSDTDESPAANEQQADNCINNDDATTTEEKSEEIVDSVNDINSDNNEKNVETNETQAENNNASEAGASNLIQTGDDSKSDSSVDIVPVPEEVQLQVENDNLKSTDDEMEEVPADPTSTEQRESQAEEVLEDSDNKLTLSTPTEEELRVEDEPNTDQQKPKKLFEDSDDDDSAVLNF